MIIFKRQIIKYPKCFFTAFLLALIFCLNVSCEKKNEVSTNYTNHDKDFSIVFPDDWDVQEGQMELDVIALSQMEGPDDPFRENISVSSAKQTIFLTGKEILDGYTPRLKVMVTEFKILEEGEIEIGPVKCPWIKYHQRQGVFDMVVTLYAIPGKDFGYLIFCTAEKKSAEKFDETFKNIAKSFRVIQ